MPKLISFDKLYKKVRIPISFKRDLDLISGSIVMTKE